MELDRALARPMSEQGRLRAYQVTGAKVFHVGDTHIIWTFCGMYKSATDRILAVGPLGGESVADFAARLEMGGRLSLCGNCRRAIPNYCAGCGRRKGHGHDEGCVHE